MKYRIFRLFSYLIKKVYPDNEIIMCIAHRNTLEKLCDDFKKAVLAKANRD